MLTIQNVQPGTVIKFDDGATMTIRKCGGGPLTLRGEVVSIVLPGDGEQRRFSQLSVGCSVSGVPVYRGQVTGGDWVDLTPEQYAKICEAWRSPNYWNSPTQESPNADYIVDMKYAMPPFMRTTPPPIPASNRRY